MKTTSLSPLMWKFLAAVFLPVYAFALAEIGVRLIRPQPLMPRYTTAAPYGIRQHVPNATYQHITGDGVSNYRINGQGLRAEKDFPLQPPAGYCRIGMFGASYFMGYEVDLQDTMSSQLEGQLRKRGYQVEVLNFALAGFGTAEMLRSYEGLGRRFELDVTLFEWAADDLNDNIRSNMYDIVDGRAIASDRSYLPAVAVQDFLAKFGIYRLMVEKSHFYSFLREWAGARAKVLLTSYRQLKGNLGELISKADAPKPEHSGGDGREKATLSPAQLSMDIVEHAQEVIENDGKSFYLVEIPGFGNRTKFTSTLSELPAERLRGINSIPMLEAFEEAKGADTRLFFEKGHFHYTPLGNGVAAREVSDRLQSDGVLMGCRVTPENQ